MYTSMESSTWPIHWLSVSQKHSCMEIILIHLVVLFIWSYSPIAITVSFLLYLIAGDYIYTWT